MDWQAIVSLATDEPDVTLTLTGLERQLALTLFSSLSEVDFIGELDATERDEMQATRDMVIDKLS